MRINPVFGTIGHAAEIPQVEGVLQVQGISPPAWDAPRWDAVAGRVDTSFLTRPDGAVEYVTPNITWGEMPNINMSGLTDNLTFGASIGSSPKKEKQGIKELRELSERVGEVSPILKHEIDQWIKNNVIEVRSAHHVHRDLKNEKNRIKETLIKDLARELSSYGDMEEDQSVFGVNYSMRVTIIKKDEQ